MGHVRDPLTKFVIEPAEVLTGRPGVLTRAPLLADIQAPLRVLIALTVGSHPSLCLSF